MRRRRRSSGTHGRDQDTVTGLDGDLNALSVLVKTSRSDSEDAGLRELLNGRLGEEDSGGGLGLSLDALNKNTVEEGGKSLDGAEGGGLSSLLAGRQVSRGLAKPAAGWGGLET
jgi:hypothetical protein